jgi:hypothetical protein
MTLEEIAAGLEEHHREWATENVAQLDVITKNPHIAKLISRFIEIAASLPNEGTIGHRVKEMARLIAVSNFRLGLLIGALLWKPKEDEDDKPVMLPEPQEKLGTISERCEKCETTGEVCLKCDESRFECSCGLGEYSPVTCTACGGEGYLPNE